MLISSCTAIKLTSAAGNPYLFRTCDLDSDIYANGAHLSAFPAESELFLSHTKIRSEYSFMGMSFSHDPHWLMDGINHAGLCGGLLMLYEGTSLPAHPRGIVGMEFVTVMLASCANIDEVIRRSANIRILDVPHTGGSAAATMHFFFMDANGKTAVLEAADPLNKGKLTAYTPSVGVLTNSPPYPAQMDNLQWFLAHSPELRGKDLLLDGQRIPPAPDAPHLCSSGTFPASYASYDRFIRAAVLKSLNDGNFTDEQMLPLGYNLMHALLEPQTEGIFHYTRLDEKTLRPIGCKNSFTQYIIIYDICREALFIRPYDTLAWSSLKLTDLPNHPSSFALCHDPQKGIYPLK